MRLAEFLEKSTEEILAHWEPFAATLLPAALQMDSVTLRDHAAEILHAVARDLRTTQTSGQQDRKSRGLAVRSASTPNTAAETHATLRAAAGFTAQQLVSEYRALRATVLRLWLAKVSRVDREVVDDIGRFNEAIDQAVAESVDYYTQEVERWRNIFLGVLGHELRGPLHTMLMAAQLMKSAPEPAVAVTYIPRITRGGARLKLMLDDLLDYNRSALGLGLVARPAPMDMASVCEEEVELGRSMAPNAEILLETDGDTLGTWDSERIRQALGNLLSNAVKYGDLSSPIVVRFAGRDETVHLSVANTGPTLPPDQLDQLFDPLHRRPSSNAEVERKSLGLGLYVVREIAKAHGGTVGVTSEGGTTCFELRLPRFSVAMS